MPSFIVDTCTHADQAPRAGMIASRPMIPSETSGSPRPLWAADVGGAASDEAGTSKSSARVTPISTPLLTAPRRQL